MGANPTRRPLSAGSNRSSYGGNEVAEAFGKRVTKYGDSASVYAVTRVNARLERRATTKNNENHSVCDRFSIAYFLLERPYPDWVSS